MMLLDFFRRSAFVIFPRPSEFERALNARHDDLAIRTSAALASARRDAVLDFWRQGHDTFSIASRMQISEVAVCRILQADRDERRGRP